eukprot:3363109-Rhodomonas_salina.1
MSGTGQDNSNTNEREPPAFNAAAMLDGTEFTPEEFVKAQRAMAERNCLAGTSMMVNTVAMMEAKRIMRTGKTMAD